MVYPSTKRYPQDISVFLDRSVIVKAVAENAVETSAKISAQKRKHFPAVSVPLICSAYNKSHRDAAFPLELAAHPVRIYVQIPDDLITAQNRNGGVVLGKRIPEFILGESGRGRHKSRGARHIRVRQYPHELFAVAVLQQAIAQPLGLEPFSFKAYHIPLRFIKV